MPVDFFGLVLEQFVIFRAQAPERLHGLRDFPFAVVQFLGPGVLLEADQGGLILGDDAAEPVGGNNLGIGQVADDLADAPFAGGRLEIEFGARHSGSDDGNQFASAAEAFQECGNFAHGRWVLFSSNRRSSCSIHSACTAVCTCVR
jgi:hypothetical protein